MRSRHRADVTLTDDEFTARFGPWRVATPLSNIAEAQLTGPFSVLKTIGPGDCHSATGV